MTAPGDPGYAARARAAAGAGETMKPRVARQPWTLRKRLLAILLLLLAAVSLAVGVLSVAILHASLVDRVDEQLRSAVDRGRGADIFTAPGDPGSDAGPLLRVPGQAPGTIGALVYGGVTVSSGYLDEAGQVTRLDDAQQNALAEVVGTLEPTTVDLGELGSYRASYRPILTNGTDVGSNGAALVIALPLADVESTSMQLAITIAVVGFLGIVTAIVVGSWLINGSLAPLRRLTQTAREVSELPLDRGEVALSQRVPESTTEVGQLGAAFNRMLGHVSSALTSREASERKVRQFVADASHELRTPLASIRGYSELTRRSGETLPTDAAHALGRIESESVRMTELVDDLLLLARLDEGRELDRSAVDLSAIVVDAVSDAAAAGQDHHWDLDLPPEPVEVVGDSPRLRQVLGNLLANARVHTPAGTRVTTTLAVDDGVVHLVVADDGPGIDAAVRESLFERFARGDSSRSRAAGSTGLGLAIVEAVVHAHHGTVSVESEPGDTRFIVKLSGSGLDA
ncbi:sensor histidine kinase [Agromyces atrinae]|uniref:histidine kinase n=2 Tax=Agromyces atrinae TaxID=592376 RepID=A0A852SKR5_9MICO|nr:HAMP domain-containing sensor histidine kinase [Agromyces atrinae]NYD67197.1 two-component system OmpR family sensor kinase [Agromyces atrinae]